jgi:hypothetical protein
MTAPSVPAPQAGKLYHPDKPEGAIWEGHFRTYQRTAEVGPEQGYRPGTKVPCFPMNFTLADGGMGDYICWSAGLLWVAENVPFIEGRVFAPAFFIEFVRAAFRPYPQWKVFLAERIQEYYEENSLVLGPGINGHQQLLNAVGTHLLDLGFAYFCNMSPPPSVAGGYHYPEFTFSERTIPRKLTPGKYVVFTPGGTTSTRKVPGEYWNPVIDEVLRRGLTPVFLGKSHMTPEHKAIFPEGTHYEKGHDLRDQTTTLEAAAIMQHAACTLGLDNGLLHLAACVPSNIIFGYNIAAPSQRRPVRRLPGVLRDITLTKEELSCIHCQTNMKQQNLINFRNCFYGDVKCLSLLFENGSERWIRALSEILDSPAEAPALCDKEGQEETLCE